LARFNELGKRQSELNAALAGGDAQSGQRCQAGFDGSARVRR